MEKSPMLKHILKRFDVVPSVLRWIVLIVWMAIFLTYLLQSSAHPILSTGVPDGPPTPERDAFFSSVHLAAYTFTTLLWVWVLITMTSLKRALMIAFVIVMSMGILTELGQTLTPDRHFQWIDLAANAIGMIIGLGIYYELCKPRNVMFQP
jgi:VanZ family protein